MSAPTDRRRIQRVKLLQPLPGKLGAQRVYILDISRDGMRVAHQESLGRYGDRHSVDFEWDGRRISLECELAHTAPQRSGTRTVFHSGMNIVSISRSSEAFLRELIVWHVERALDEQKANARGIPAIAAQSFQTGNSREFVRHIFSATRWHETLTTDSKQPVNGFTISATESTEEVEMLRAAWQSGDGAARKLIQRMAELSISRVEGIPTRRYVP